VAVEVLAVAAVAMVVASPGILAVAVEVVVAVVVVVGVTVAVVVVGVVAIGVAPAKFSRSVQLVRGDMGPSRGACRKSEDNGPLEIPALSRSRSETNTKAEA